MATVLLNTASKRNHLNSLKAFLPAILGTVVEYYDYALYGFIAHLLAEQFFPVDDPTVALLKTFGIFLAGSLSKPLGALIFGYIGDRFGRSVSLKISMVGIALPTTLIGLMPTYQEIGWLAPCFLLICRILQGIFTAGESDGARIFIVESFFQTKPCFASSVSGIACLVGIYLASLVSSAIMTLGDPLHVWRIPFLFGGAMGVLVFLGRFYLIETPEFIQYLTEKAHTHSMSSARGFLDILSNHKRMILATILFCGASGGTYHFYLVFLGKYLSTTLQILDPKIAAQYTSQAILIYTICIPLASLIADYLGLIRMMQYSCYVLLGFILINILSISNLSMSMELIGSTAGALAFFQAPMIALLLQRITVGKRYRILSFGHAIGSMLFSGSAPLLSLWLWHTTQLALLPFLYFTFLVLLGYLAVFLLKNTS